MANHPPPTGPLRVLGRTLAWPDGTSLFDALMQAGILLPSACAGHGRCALCVVWLTGAAVPAAMAVERRLLDAQALADGARLACQHYKQAAWIIDRVGAP